MPGRGPFGADSTGFAVYGPPRDSGYVLRGMGFDKTRMDSDLSELARDPFLIAAPAGSLLTEQPQPVALDALAVSEAGDQTRLFIDGVKVATGGAPSLAGSNNPVMIGEGKRQRPATRIVPSGQKLLTSASASDSRCASSSGSVGSSVRLSASSATSKSECLKPKGIVQGRPVAAWYSAASSADV